MQPKVSVCVVTYNHEAYIAQCLDGILCQKVDFDFEIVIGEDKSTDNTFAIIEDYRQKHPEIISVLSGPNNLGGQANMDRTRRACKGEYIALLDGDDYWTNPLKLQMQVDLIEKYPQASMCVALHTQVNERTNETLQYHAYSGRNFPLIYFEDLTQYFHTATYLVRKPVFDLVWTKYRHLMSGDTSTRYLLINQGPFVVLNELVSVYRITGLGAWSNMNWFEQDWEHYLFFKAFRKEPSLKKQKYYFLRREKQYLKAVIGHFEKQKKNKERIYYTLCYLMLTLRYGPPILLKRIHGKIDRTTKALIGKEQFSK